MKVALVTLSNDLYKESRERLVQSAMKYGVDEVVSYDINDIKHLPFYQANKHIFEWPRGMGYWLWKPLIINEVLKKLSEEDVLVYADSGIEIIKSLFPLINLCKTAEPILLFGNANDINACWTKRDCFVLMDCDEEQYWFGPHCDASTALFRKCERTMDFVRAWQRYAGNESILTDLPNTRGNNLALYQDHRHDQSVISLLAQKHKINLYRAPSQFGNHYKMYDFRIAGEFNCISQGDQQQVNYYGAVPYYNSHYGQLLNHHRSKTQSQVLVSTPQMAPKKYYYLKRIYRRARQALNSVISIIK